jgi:hypothetical protein
MLRTAGGLLLVCLHRLFQRVVGFSCLSGFLVTSLKEASMPRYLAYRSPPVFLRLLALPVWTTVRWRAPRHTASAKRGLPRPHCLSRHLATGLLSALYLLSPWVAWAAASASPAVRPVPATPFKPLPGFRHLGTFEAEVDFLWETGKTDGSQIFAYWKDHGPGYLLAALEVDGQRGLPLPSGVYRWTFRLHKGSEPTQLPGSPVFRISVWDVTTGERLTERVLHASDFPANDVFYDRALIMSTVGRESHRFEPRVYWEDYVDGFVDYVRLDQAIAYPTTSLDTKAYLLDQELQAQFLDPIPGTNDPGLVVARGNAPQRGDSATWTALYTASQALRLRANPHDINALLHMERGFQALHRLHDLTQEPGIVARYADADNQWVYADPCDGTWKAGRVNRETDGAPLCRLPDATCVATGSRQYATCPSGERLYEEWSSKVISEDIYTAFAFAVGVGYDLIADPQLKAAVAADIQAIAHHLLAQDFLITKPSAPATKPVVLNFNPYLPTAQLRDIVGTALADGDLSDVEALREQVWRLLPHAKILFFDLRLVSYQDLRHIYNFTVQSLYPLVSWCVSRPPLLPAHLLPEVERLLADLGEAILDEDVDQIVQQMPRVVRTVGATAQRLLSFAREGSRFFKDVIECVGRLPNSEWGEQYRDLLRYLDDRIIPELDRLVSKIPQNLQRLEEFRFDASNAIAAAHILAVARFVAPGVFETPYYQHLLGGEKDLLKTIETWVDTPETLAVLLGGDLNADKTRGGGFIPGKGGSDTEWRSFAALYNLIRLEPQPQVRDRLRQILERVWTPHADEGNAFYDAIRAASGGLPTALPFDAGVMGWQLANMPVLRTGYGSDGWNDLAADLGSVSGGLLSWDTHAVQGFVRDPVPVAVRALHQVFLWQRNPRKIGYNGDADGTVVASVDYLLPYYMAQAAQHVLLNPPVIGEAPRIRPAQFLKTSGEQGITRGKSYRYECKTLGGIVRTPSELGRLPGPYGSVAVGRDGARLAGGYAHIRTIVTEGNWNLTADVQPAGLSWWAEVCNGALHVDGYEGSELKFVASILAPATTQSDHLGAQCPFKVLASSGEQGETLGSGLKSKTQELHISVDVPPGYGPLGGPMGTFSLDGNGYDDEHVQVRVLVYKRVTAFSLTKTPTGVHVSAQIQRPRKFRGGAEIKLVVELLRTQERAFRIGALPSRLSFTAAEGEEAPAQSFCVQVAAANCALGTKAWYAQAEGNDGPWAFLAAPGGLLPGQLRVRASALNLPASATPYRGHIAVDIPRASNSPQYINLELYVIAQGAPAPPLQEREYFCGANYSVADRWFMMADINGDGQADVVRYELVSGYVSAWLSNGAGDFLAAGQTYIGSGGSPADRWFTTADINGDGQADVVKYEPASGYVGVWLSKGDGTFATAGQTYIGSGGSPADRWFTTADINGDGQADIALR